MASSSRSESQWFRVGCVALAALVIAGFQSAAGAFYQGFRVPQGTAMNHLLPDELAHYALYLFAGVAAAALLYRSLRGLPLCEGYGARLGRFCDRPLAPALAAATCVFAANVALAQFVLGHAVTTDDEHAYSFIARTLRTGAAVAPSPGGDLEFYREQFVVLDERVRYGKYTIGHPLLLALGQAVGAEALVVPLLTALVVFPLHSLGALLFGRRVAGAACLLYAASPEVWFVGATLLSQPASTLALVGALALLASRRCEDGPPLRECALAGACLGFGVLVRPLPAALFAAVAGAHLLLGGTAPLRQRVRRAVAFGIPLVALSGVVLLVNQAQTGAATVSGYQQFHSPGQGIEAIVGGDGPLLAMSLASAVVRTNFWLFGWPLSLVPCLLAGRLPRPWLLGGLLAAVLAYRFVSPKAGVGGTGAIYMFEAIPVLCLLAAQGIARIARGEVSLGGARAGSATLVPALAALFAVSLTLFVPPKLADLRRMGLAQREVERQVAGRQLRSALVFHEGVVPPWTGLSWAYFPRCNGPRLDDEVVFVRFQRQGALSRNVDFWRRRHPERSAWYFGWEPQRGPFLKELPAYLQEEAEELRRADAGVPAPSAAHP